MIAALYNEIDPFASQWTRNLIAAGHVAPGVVDERSIVDLRAVDVAGRGQRHFFAGLAGWSYALRLAGVPDDADIWTGSCPCQPFSGAGRKRGFADTRHLWPVWFGLIAECRPAVVLGEQVASPDGRAWFAAVRADLESLGYAVGAADLCAAGVGAPHIRQRLYFVAYADGFERVGRERVPVQPWGPQQADPDAGRGGAVGELAYADDAGSQGRGERRNGADQWAARAGGVVGGMADDARLGRIERIDEREATPDHGARLADDRGPGRLGNPGGARGRRDAGADARAEAASSGARPLARRVGDEPGVAGADGRLADAAGPRRGHAQDAGSNRDCSREGSRLLEPERGGDARDPWADAEWIPCSDGKSRPAQPGIHPLAHGVPGRVGNLRAYGNAIVSEQAATFICAALQAGAVTP